MRYHEEAECKGQSVEGRRNPMIKTAIVFTLCAVLLAPSFTVEAQQSGKVPRIGYLSRRGAPTPTTPDPNGNAFRRGLRDLGYVEGKNILIEFRYAEGKTDRLPDLVAELLQLKVDILVSGTSQAIRVAKQAT
jgi:putative tryptophan/tyrosine transport system substrate-binding protein